MIATIFGSLALRGASAAFAAPPAGGFVHDPASLTARGGTMFSEPPLEPGQSVTRHATVASTGPAAPVHLFGEVSGTGLARFLTIRVTRDTGPTDALAPAGGGTAPTVVFRGRMSAFPRGCEVGLDVGGARTSRHLQTFRFEITLADDPRAQGLTAGIDFRWEARQR